MVEVFREVRRVLRKDGTLWLNLGSSYAGGGRGWESCDPNGKQLTNRGTVGVGPTEVPPGFKPKDLVPIPWMVAMALQADGWWLRSDIIWAKPNPMPESVTDRPTKAHEYLFLLTKSANYFYDAEAIKERQQTEAHNPGNKYRNGGERCQDFGDDSAYRIWASDGNRNKRSVWTVATAPYPEAHFATYPPDLIKPCIMAGTSAKGCCARCGAPWERIVERGREHDHETYRDGKTMDGPYAKQAEIRNGILPTSKTLGWQPSCGCYGDEPIHQTFVNELRLTPCTVLDPFAGSGTTGSVAIELGRRPTLIELNPTYVKLIEQRCTTTIGLPLA